MNIKLNKPSKKKKKKKKDERTNQGIRLKMRKKERYILNKTCD